MLIIWEAALCVVQYAKGSPHQGILLRATSPLILTVCKLGRLLDCAITGYFVSLVALRSVKKQRTNTRFHGLLLRLNTIPWLPYVS